MLFIMEARKIVDHNEINYLKYNRIMMSEIHKKHSISYVNKRRMIYRENTLSA